MGKRILFRLVALMPAALLGAGFAWVWRTWLSPPARSLVLRTVLEQRLFARHVGERDLELDFDASYG